MGLHKHELYSDCAGFVINKYLFHTFQYFLLIKKSISYSEKIID